MTNPRTATNKALQLLQDAKQARIVRVDLERGVMTMTLPDGLQVSREPVSLVPASLVDEAKAAEPEMAVIFKTDTPHSFRLLNFWDGGYEAVLDGAEYNVHRRTNHKNGQELRDGPFWGGYVSREDSDGQTWTAQIPKMLVNDFGVLVPVPRGQA